MNSDNMFATIDFGPFIEYLEDDDITDMSYSNNGQLWLRSLSKGNYRVDNEKINNEVVEKLAFQCSNCMGTTFNMAKPFLDAESAELRMNFVHESIATNGIALVIRKTPAKIRLQEEKLLEDNYVTKDVHDFLIQCVLGHCNIIVCGETGSGKTEFVKYLASHTRENEKIISIEDTLELHLDKIYPNRDIVAMKTNNIASYSDVLVTCMRQNPKWILLSEVRSAEAVSAVRNSISSGHNILSTIHSDKARSIPHRMYSLMETEIDVDQFLKTIYRYVQLGVHIKAYYSTELQKFHREIDEITEFYVDENNDPKFNVIYQKYMGGKVVIKEPSASLKEYLLAQNIKLLKPLSNGETGPDDEVEAILNNDFSSASDTSNSTSEPSLEVSIQQPVESDTSVQNVQSTESIVAQPTSNINDSASTVATVNTNVVARPKFINDISAISNSEEVF
ncbi:MAG: CpaF family protein [Bacilli bacterium]|nr:CpaF family protein [Bacilli bacterium]